LSPPRSEETELTETPTIIPGAALPNGAKVIAFAVRPNRASYAVVIADTNGIAGNAYATWLADADWSCFYGRYFDDFNEAMADWKDRI
jgi:hypothetical protein